MALLNGIRHSGKTLLTSQRPETIAGHRRRLLPIHHGVRVITPQHAAATLLKRRGHRPGLV
jgi:hypothetical protein